MKKSSFCQQAQIRADIIEVFDLHSVNRHQMMCNSWFGVAVKTKGTTDDEGQIGELRECGENENGMSAGHIWCLGLRSQKYESQVLLQTLTLGEFTKPTEEDSFS